MSKKVHPLSQKYHLGMDNDTAESWRREFSVLSDHFSFETKTAMKNKVFFKMRGKKKKEQGIVEGKNRIQRA